MKILPDLLQKTHEKLRTCKFSIKKIKNIQNHCQEKQYMQFLGCFFTVISLHQTPNSTFQYQKYAFLVRIPCVF